MIEEPLATSLYQEAGRLSPILVEKRWGKELIFTNGDGHSTDGFTYCMKTIHLDPNEFTSLHFHIKKHETIYVIAGTLILEYNDGKGSSGTVLIERDQAITIPPGFQHRLRATDEPLMLLEASTLDDPNDSVRVSL